MIVVHEANLVSAHRPGSSNTLHADFLKFIQDEAERDDVEEFEEWAIEPCIPLLQEFSQTAQNSERHSLHD